MFFGGNDTNSLVAVGSAAKTGFETSFMAAQFYAFGYAEALDVNGKVLGESPTTQTFVPYSAPSNATFAQNSTVSSNSTATFRRRWLS